MSEENKFGLYRVTVAAAAWILAQDAHHGLQMEDPPTEDCESRPDFERPPIALVDQFRCRILKAIDQGRLNATGLFNGEVDAEKTLVSITEIYDWLYEIGLPPDSYLNDWIEEEMQFETLITQLIRTARHARGSSLKYARETLDRVVKAIAGEESAAELRRLSNEICEVVEREKMLLTAREDALATKPDEVDGYTTCGAIEHMALRPVSRTVAAQETLLAKLNELGYASNALPPYRNGRRSEAKEAMRANLSLSNWVVDKAWRELLKDGRIAYAQPLG